MAKKRNKKMTPLQSLRREYQFYKQRHNSEEMARIESLIEEYKTKEKRYRENRKYNEILKKQKLYDACVEPKLLPENEVQEEEFNEKARANGVDFKKIENNPTLYASILRSSLLDFVTVFYQYTQNERFEYRPFHGEIIKSLEDFVFERNEKKNLYIGIPPRHSKSTISYLFLAWSYTHNKNCNFILTSVNDKLSQKFSSDIMKVISSPLYQKLFNLPLDDSVASKDIWQIKNGGSFRACTLKGAVIGFGAGTLDGFGGALIIDDFMKAADANSENAKREVENLYTDSLKTRLNNQEKTPIIIIAQRLAYDDLIAWIKNNEPDDWKFIEIPALDENENAIWPKRISAKVLIEMREKEPQKFWAQYQQEPKPLGGSVIRGEWFQFYNPKDRLQFRRIFMTADTALKANTWNDYSAFGIWGAMQTRDYSRLYLLDLLHGKYEAADLEGVVRKFISKYNNRYGRISAIYIEDKASGVQLVQDLKRSLSLPVIPLKVQVDKYTRVCEATPRIQAGDIFLPDGPQDLISRKVISECECFCADMSHKHDDIVDMMVHAIKCGFMRRGLF